MNSRQFAIVTLLFGAVLFAAGIAQPGQVEPVRASPPEPVAIVAGIADRPAAKPQQAIRVILPSPYEAR